MHGRGPQLWGGTVEGWVWPNGPNPTFKRPPITVGRFVFLTFCNSTFCKIRRFVFRRFVIRSFVIRCFVFSTFYNSTFCILTFCSTIGRLGLVAALAAAIEDDRWIVCRPLQTALDLSADSIFNILLDKQGLEKKRARRVPKLLRSG